MKQWVKLPEDSKITCGCTSWGSSRDEDNLERCGKPAVWVYESRCSCGACDMTRYFCDEHKVQDEQERNRKVPEVLEDD
jgi:hypothetical protein